jgi:hypothetical protein
MGYVFLPTRDGLRIVKPDKPPAEGPVLLERLKGKAPVVLKLHLEPRIISSDNWHACAIPAC